MMAPDVIVVDLSWCTTWCYIIDKPLPIIMELIIAALKDYPEIGSEYYSWEILEHWVDMYEMTPNEVEDLGIKLDQFGLDISTCVDQAVSAYGYRYRFERLLGPYIGAAFRRH